MGKSFAIKNMDEIATDIDEGAARSPATRRVFLLEGDALVLDNTKLLPILRKLNEGFPKLARVSSYANGYNITQRMDDELAELKNNKMNLVYLGLESGSQEVLTRCNKRATADEMVEAVTRAGTAGIKSSVMVLLGLGGKERSGIHVKETITALNKMQPRYLSFLSVMLIPGTPLFADCQEELFGELDPTELLVEARDIIKGLTLKKTIFRSDHASNYLSLEGRFPQDKDKLLSILGQAIKGDINLRPEFSRGL